MRQQTNSDENLRLAATLGHLAARSRRRMYVVGAFGLLAGIVLGRCGATPAEPHSVAISTAGQPASVRELEGRVELLELQVGARDDAISALLVRCGAYPEAL